MNRRLKFGRASLEIYFDHKRLIGLFEGPLADARSIAAKVTEGLEAPLEAPPFALAFAPGDRIAIALDADLPNAEMVLGPILTSLASVGVALADIVVLAASESGEPADVDALLQRFPPNSAPGKIVRHDPADESQLAYLAASKDGRRVYLPRVLIDADATITVGLAGHSSLVGHSGSLSAAFPMLSNVETQERSRALALESMRHPASLRKRQLCEEVGWLLGTFYSVNASLDRNGEIDRIWVGQTAAVQHASDKFAETEWTIVPQSEAVDLTVAVVSESNHSTNWSHVAAALDAAAQFTESGDILLLSDLAEPPGPTGQWLIDNDNPWQTLARLRESREADVVATAQCAQALSKHKVYLHSALKSELVESMGMTPVAGQKEVQKLVSANKRVFLIEQADRVAIAPAKASPPPS